MISGNPFKTSYQEFIYKSRYARYLHNEKRRENWDETVNRYIEYLSKHILEKCSYVLNNQLRNDIYNAIYHLDVMPSMRALMTAGPAAARDNVAAYNCSYLPIDDPKSFDEAMYILMCGTGVGFSVERQYVNSLPEIPDKLYDSDTVIVVKDSKEGWSKAFRQLISLLYCGEIPKWDVTKVRPSGARLKTFGGRASGPGPLVDLFMFTISKFKEASGRKLSSIEVHDIMCKIGEIVVVGGVRRSAMISFSNLSDDRMRHAKSGQWWVENVQRALANNSVAYTEKPDVGAFMREWVSLYESKSGERGIFNSIAAKKQAGRNGRRNADWEFRANPCSEIILRPYQFCVSGDTRLITDKNGIKPIASFENKTVSIWNGVQWSNVFVTKTRTNQELLRVRLSDGSYLDCTKDHRFSVKNRFEVEWRTVEASQLCNDEKYPLQCQDTIMDNQAVPDIENAYTLGFALGDGFVNQGKVCIDLYGVKQKCPVIGTRGKEYIPRLSNMSKVRVVTDCHVCELLSLRNDPEAIYDLSQYSRQSFLKFIAGWADADGSNASNGIRVYISDEHRARAMQLVLTKNGIVSSVNLCSKKGVRTNKGTRKKDLWYLQITNCGDIPCQRLITTNGRPAKYKGKYQNIVGIEKLSGLQDVYCFHEPYRHMGVFGNILTYQCNLSEVVVRQEDTEQTLRHKVLIATILGTFQSSLTHFPYLRKIWTHNTEEERLLGVSLTGIMDNSLTNGKTGNLPDLLSSLKQYAVEINKSYSKDLGIPQSTAITCVKPSGTVSQLVDAASGIHARHSKYYIRSVRADNKDPLTDFMKASGIYNEPDVTKPHATTVFFFPIKAPEVSVLRNDMSAIEQLEIWKQYQLHWCEHKPSVTISVKENEWPEVGAWVYNNFDFISGVSFLPYSEHTYKQAPYQECNQEQYEKLLSNTPIEIDWSHLCKFEKEDTTVGSKTMACSADSCEIVDLIS